MLLVSNKVSRRYLLCCVLFIILFTLVISPWPVKAKSIKTTVTPMTQSDAWAGYYTQGSTYTKVNMYFRVPTLTATKGRNTAVYIWDGLQGNKHLVQAGINAKIDANGIQTDNAWWYVTGAGIPPAPDLGLPMNPGDRIWVYVSSNAENDGYDGFLVKNLTQGTYRTHYEYDPNGLAGDNASASCVVERQLGIIANFGTVSLTGCKVYKNGQRGMVPIGSVPGSGENMVGGNTTLVSTSPLTNRANFDLTWKNSGIGLP